MTPKPRIPLDNAATSFPKPDAVYAAVDDFNRRLGAAAGRGGYAAAGEAAEIVARCRRNVARLLNAEGPEQIVFTFNGTDSLNLALHGLLRPGDHVVTTAAEHNSVLRPLRTLAASGVETTVIDCDAAGRVDPAAVRTALRPTTRLVAVTHASNVTGAIQPVAEIAADAKAAGAFMLLDAAQTAGHLPINLRTLPVDLLACPGHKGLLGPLGTGLLYLRPGIENHLRPLRQGGTGTSSDDDRQPDALPEKYESGNLNLPGLAGLEAATRWLLDRGVASLCRHEMDLTERLLDGLRPLPGMTVFGPDPADDRVGVVSIVAEHFPPHDLAAVLAAEFGIEARAGLHCAPLLHRRLGTADRGGTLRFSFGAFTTAEQIDAALAALRAVV